MRIGIDVDNVLSNFNDELLKEFLNHDKELRNSGIVNKDAYITRGMFDWSKEEQDNFYYNNIERIVKKLDVIDNAPEYIKKLRELGHEIYIVTGRDNGGYSDPYKMIADWLQEHNIEYDKLLFTNAYNSPEKAKICIDNNISIMIDDSTRISQEVDKVGIKALLMDTPYNRQINSLTRVHNWKEIYEFINNYKKETKIISKNKNNNGIIIAGFGAIGKTTLGNKYNNIIDLESGYYRWDNTGFEHIPYEQRKGKKLRPENKEWPINYHKAVVEARKKYDVILTSMHWHLLDFLEENQIDYYLAYPTLDSEKILEERCYLRGNNKVFTEKLKKNLHDWNAKIEKYHPKKLLIINKNEFLEDVLKKEKLIV